MAHSRAFPPVQMPEGAHRRGAGIGQPLLEPGGAALYGLSRFEDRGCLRTGTNEPSKSNSYRIKWSRPHRRARSAKGATARSVARSAAATPDPGASSPAPADFRP